MFTDTRVLYEPLPNSTTTRVLLLAPGNPDDEIYGWLVTADLDQDHGLFPDATPRPMDIPMEFLANSSSGEERSFAVPVDIYLDDSIEAPEPGLVACPTHPFQRYTALSYVWGDASDPEYITLNGSHQFPVTRNLYAALKVLRKTSPYDDCAFWIDAICINQSDYVEKKTQIALMRRIYEQAQEVTAYVPLSPKDQDNISELVPKIWAAGQAYEEWLKSKDDEVTANIGSITPNKSLTSIPQLDLERVTIDTQKRGRPDALLHSYLLENPNGRFLEDCGLPVPDSPLWASWRRLFASPYFRRIWILQEFALAKSLKLRFGTGSADAFGLIEARVIIMKYSGMSNAGYLGHSQPGDPEHLTRDAVLGAQGADSMFIERSLVGSGADRSKLIGQLSRARMFEATDERDKIYALIGLARDADFFKDYVEYAPEETPEKAYIRFASLFVEKGEGLDLLLDAGLGNAVRKGGEELPSWVPNWAQPSHLPHPTNPPLDSSPSQPQMRVLEDGKTLSVRCALVDEIEQISDVAFRHNNRDNPSDAGEAKPPSPGLGLGVDDFLYAISKGLSMILSSPKIECQASFHNVLELLFQILTQPVPVPAPAPAPTLEGKDKGQDEEGNEETKALRIGFQDFLAFIIASGRGAKDTVDLKEGEGQVIRVKNPDEWQKFLKRAFQTTAHRRFCIAKSGKIGLVPDATEAGDRVMAMEGIDLAFVLRPTSHHESNVGEEQTTDSEKFKLVGHAYLQGSKDKGWDGQLQDILLV